MKPPVNYLSLVKDMGKLTVLFFSQFTLSPLFSSVHTLWKEITLHTAFLSPPPGALERKVEFHQRHSAY